MSQAPSETLHATCVAIDGRGVLIEGPSGSGKSDLALRLIDRGAVLVSDDYTDLSVRDGALRARSPARLVGRIEVRGLGIVEQRSADEATIALLVTLGQSVPRMPEPTSRDLAGVAVPSIVLDALEASAPIKVERALATLGLSL